ncbi:MAG: carboxypeptidase Q, partial [Porticoccaceae bacterium]
MYIRKLMIGLLLVVPMHLNAEDVLDQSVRDDANALILQSFQSDLGYQIIESLTTEVGQRLAGTEAEARARDWGIAKFKELGFKNVRIEPFQVDRWERHSEHAEITSPFPQKLMITALGGSIATGSDGIVGHVVRFENLQALKDAPMKGLKGKIVFVDEYMT